MGVLHERPSGSSHSSVPGFVAYPLNFLGLAGSPDLLWRSGARTPPRSEVEAGVHGSSDVSGKPNYSRRVSNCPCV